jgi:hypothetical protein
LSRTEDGKVVLGLHRAWRDGTTSVVFDPLAFLRRLAAIVPHPRVHLIHYHGVLAPAAAWRSEIVPAAVEPSTVGGKVRRTSWIPWAELLKRVFGVDALVCPRCGGRMVLRAVVELLGPVNKLLGVIRTRAAGQAGQMPPALGP